MLRLTRTVFLFGVLGRAPYGYMTFGPDGRIRGYNNPMEYSYSFEDGVLSIYSVEGKRTSTLVESKSHPMLFLPAGLGSHTLEPVFSLGALPVSDRKLPPVFVNTVAKAGTYLVAQALREEGYRPLDLHLSSHFFHDNRGVPESEIHWDPNTRRVSCEASVIAGLIRPGEFMVGHVDDLDQLRRIADLGLEMINVVRHPYGQMRSMLTFKLHKTKPKPEDLIWHSMEGLDQFKAFMLTHPAAYWLQFSRQITDHFPYLRFEDLTAGRVPAGSVSEPLRELLECGLKTAIGKKTSTYMAGVKAGEASYFEDPAIATYLQTIGVADYAAKFWGDLMP